MKRPVMGVMAVLLLFLLLLAAGCKGQEPGAPNNSQGNHQNGGALSSKPGDFFPLLNGSSWEYLGEGNEYATFDRQVIFVEGNLAQTREDNGGTVSSTVYKSTEDAVTIQYFQGEAYEDKNFLKEPPNANTIVIQAPLRVGSQWNVENGSREIVDLDAAVDTPAGSFSGCLKIKISYDSGAVGYEYFKQGIGMVKREYESNGFSVTSSLERYNR